MVEAVTEDCCVKLQLKSIVLSEMYLVHEAFHSATL